MVHINRHSLFLSHTAPIQVPRPPPPPTSPIRPSASDLSPHFHPSHLGVARSLRALPDRSLASAGLNPCLDPRLGYMPPHDPTFWQNSISRISARHFAHYRAPTLFIVTRSAHLFSSLSSDSLRSLFFVPFVSTSYFHATPRACQPPVREEKKKKNIIE